jgi:hypothetical protein
VQTPPIIWPWQVAIGAPGAGVPWQTPFTTAPMQSPELMTG